jgi:transposase InsO family protein
MHVPIPPNIFEEVSVDIVGQVPSSRAGNRYILAIQDRLSRWLMFCPSPDQSAETIARIFLTKWICVYGVPNKIISDRGTNFVSALFTELHKFVGIKPSKTVAYNPEGNGMNERSHQGLHQYLAMYLEPANRETWDTMLNVASWVHNSTKHESLGVSPYEIVTGLEPRSAQSWLPDPNEDIEKTNESFQGYYGVDKKYLQELREKARSMIGKAQTDYLSRLNKNSRDPTYKIGDMVLIRIQDRSTYVARKWTAKYKGPFIITAIIGPGVVKIKDPNSEYEDLIHIKYLRPYNTRQTPPRDYTEVQDEEEEEGLDEVIMDAPADFDKQQIKTKVFEKSKPKSQKSDDLIEELIKDESDDDAYDTDVGDDDFQSIQNTPETNPSESTDWGSTPSPTFDTRQRVEEEDEGARALTPPRSSSPHALQTPRHSTPKRKIQGQSHGMLLRKRAQSSVTPTTRDDDIISRRSDPDSSQGEGGSLTDSVVRRSSRLVNIPPKEYKEARVIKPRDKATKAAKAAKKHSD